MSPSSKLDPRYDVPAHSSTESPSRSKINGGKRGPLSGYRLSHFPSRLVPEPSLVETHDREAWTAETQPDHGFTTAIRAMGMWSDADYQALDTSRVGEWSCSDVFLLVIMYVFMGTTMHLVFAKRIDASEHAAV